MTSSSPIRPYGDTTGDGMVQLSFTLPMPHSKVADGAALQLANKGPDRAVKESPRSPRLTNVAPTSMRPRWWKSASRAQVPEPRGAASTWPGPQTRALGDTPSASGSSWTSTLSTLVLPRPGTSTRSWAFTA